MDAFFGEIRPFAFGFVPQGWIECNGQTLLIQSYAALYSILGIRYGGNGTTNFMLPDLRGRTAVGAGQGPGLSPWIDGQTLGTEQVALLSSSQIPAHNHTLVMKRMTNLTGIKANTTAAPVSASSWLSRATQVTGDNTGNFIPNFTAPPATVNTALHWATIGATSNGGAAHENRQPYLPLLYCICNDGVYPVRP